MFSSILNCCCLCGSFSHFLSTEINVFAVFPCRSNFPFDKSLYRRHNGWILHYATGGELRSHLWADNVQHSRMLHTECRLGSDEWFDEAGGTGWWRPGKLLPHITGPGTRKGKYVNVILITRIWMSMCVYLSDHNIDIL